MKWATIATLIYGIAVSAFFLFGAGMEHKPVAWNEWGDLLAGLISPVAFFWLIVGYNLQREQLIETKKSVDSQNDALVAQKQELELNRKVLEFQVKELKNAIVQQSQLVTETEKQYQLNRAAAHDGLQQFTQEMNREALSRRPFFALKPSGTWPQSANAQATVAYDVVNLGGACSVLSIHADCANETSAHAVPLLENCVFERGASVPMLVPAGMGESAAIDGFVIAYLDGSGAVFTTRAEPKAYGRAHTYYSAVAQAA